MTLALVLICTLSLTLSLLLLRQIELTRRAREEVVEWKRLYEQVRSSRAALLKTLQALERKGDTMPSRADTEQQKSPDSSEPKLRTNRPRPAAVGKPKAQESTGVGKPLILVLPIQLLSKNSRDKLHYQARRKLRKQYQEIIELKYPRHAPAPQVRQRATVTRIKGPRERDFDGQNIGAGSAIELIDAMTAAGYWVDDSPKWLETEFAQSLSGKVKGPAVVIEIRALS